MSAENLFQTRFNRYQDFVKQYTKSFNTISNLRLLVFLVGTVLTVLCLFLGARTQALAVLLFFLVVFLALVYKHSQVEQKLKTARAMLEIQRRYLSRINGQWVSLADCGQEFLDGNHPYTYDLDIFGSKSLYQWISLANTFWGRHHLKTLLADPVKNLNTIKMRQDAVRELTAKLEFCQKLELQGLLVNDVSRDIGGLVSYAEESGSLTKGIHIIRFFPLVTILAFVLSFSGWGLPVEVPIIIFGIQLLLFWAGLRKFSSDLNRVYSVHKGLGAFRNMFLLIESEQFKDDYLSTLKAELYNQTEPASNGMKRLERISDKIDLRYNPIFYFIFNIFLLWDFHCAVYLERWKIKNGKRIRAWFETIGAFEALTSLSVISHIHPEWVFPELQDHGRKIYGRDLGHPLIQSEKCVRNDIDIEDYSCIITGSNMSGKSTFLRAIGMNLVLTYAGAAVCAREFKCSIMDIFTSMVIRDDLIGGISTFYAELTRINMILRHARQGQPMLYLIDEIFRGTNSLDRIAGAQVVLKELNRDNVIGLISTHDFELCDLEKNQGLNFRNYHFEEQYTNGRIKFDYRLRPGRCTTSNARYLMNLVGISIPE
ncbi:DNA mismatch repair protein MutS, core [Syntrophomonas zehnderi OL-4]|uniref:DNA mismatch repair protein MutS, core n=1 Tax=Syntrophomonas zehnderi OL-4 TaxID=690567 RepID=A0A0E4GC52_9FIRM|nr:MutS family DNA mismatch repair protein [Syntrophomonas zehnderi]CFX89789.1 DNA mismatch repair protein MutS, core [Syntrophomonas zehnderi OL-4]